MTTKRSSKPTTSANGQKPLISVLIDDTKATSPGEVAEAVLALCVQARVPVFIYSEPGIGKSATVRAMAAAIQARLHTIMLSVREPTDQGGLPAVTDVNGRPEVRLVPPGWARELIRDKGGVVFLDEVSNATPATMNSALRVVQEGVVGDAEQLPKDTSFILAGNTPETNVGANEITAGIANRCVHIKWPFEYERWRAGMLRGWAPEDRKIAKLPADWRDGIPEMAALVVAFLDTATMLAQAQPTDIEQQAKAWPSARTWDITATMLAAADAAGYGAKTVVARTIVEGLVGEAAQTMWSSWVANMDLPRTADVMADPDGFAMPSRQDQVQAVLSGVVSYVAQHRGNVRVYMNGWRVMNRALLDDPSMAMRSAKDLGALMPPGADQEANTPFHKGLVLVAGHLKPAGVDYGRVT